MAKLDTGASSAVTTQAEACGQKELNVDRGTPPRQIATGAYYAAGSVPSLLPEVVEVEGGRYVFRIGASPRSERVTITIDTQQLVEQKRVRTINRAIQRARQR
jgi:hypothetical protein